MRVYTAEMKEYLLIGVHKCDMQELLVLCLCWDAM
jgi:hypothetical protein